MMTTQVSAAEVKAELQKGLRTFRVFEHAEKIIAGLENAQLVEAEGAARIAALRAEADDIAAKLAAAKAELADATAKSKALISETTTHANTIAADATAKATAMLAEAEAKAAEQIAAANAHTKAMDEKLGEIMVARNTAMAELAETEAKIEKAKKQIEKLLG